MAMAVQAGTMNDTVQGLILKQIDFKEYDVILTVLTKEYGKISLRAAGAGRMTSKNAGSILPYTLAEFQLDYRPEQTMFRMKTAHTKKLYRHMHEDLAASYAAGAASSAADAFSLPGEEFLEKESVFEYTEKCFSLLDKGKETSLVLCLYLTDMMDLFGIQPEVDGCAVCGSTKVAAISAAEGGFLCSEHAKEIGAASQSRERLQRFRLIVKAGMEHIDAAAEAGGAEKFDLKVLEDIVRLHGGMNMKSFALYNRLFSIE
ncbi:MAG: DNA repair protein RecO [Erysipelotrichaceae bacterium]|nr:DNA repair protein RecO [Erysipelotrichaceae bacterium]